MKDIDKYEIFFDDLMTYLKRFKGYSNHDIKIEIYKNNKIRIIYKGIEKIFTSNFEDKVDLYKIIPLDLKEDIQISKFSLLTFRKFRKIPLR